MSFVGEFGFELHVPTDHGAQLWDLVWEAGKSHGLTPVGSVALDSLSKEMGYLIYGHDINAGHTPLEAGLAWAVKKEGEFIGRYHLSQQKQTGLTRKRCTLLFESGLALGGEPVLDGEKCIGYITSANGGYTIGKHIAYAYLPIEYTKIGTNLTVEYFGQRINVTVTKQPLKKG